MATAKFASSPPRRRFRLTPLRLALACLTILLIVSGLLFAVARAWAPAQADFPTQGIGVSADSGTIDWSMVPGSGVDFAYLAATNGADGTDAAFATNLAGARAVGLRYGVEHRFSLCAGADEQARRFITSVPRDAAMLPPVVRLAFSQDCPASLSRDKLLSELNTFLNQIEAHGGKPAVIRVARDFDARYDIGSGVNRTLWLEGNFMAPSYASRPWVMWTASTWKSINGVPGSMEWDVVQP